MKDRVSVATRKTNEETKLIILLDYYAYTRLARCILI